MYLSHEFGDPTMQVVEKLGPDAIGKWLAYFKYKSELESPKTKPNPPNKSSPLPRPKSTSSRTPKRGRK